MIEVFVYTIALLILACLLFWRIYFLRKPKRTIPNGNNIVSPADGRIIKIAKFNKKNLKIEKGIFGKIKTMASDIQNSGYLISVFMSPLDIHYQMAPIDGAVLKTRYKKGKFFAAFDFEKSLQNEKNEILMKTKIGNIKIIQIAGFLARRIHCFVKKGQKIKKGQIIGLIDLGSQVCLLIPKMKLMVKEGQKVKAGETVIAKWK